MNFSRLKRATDSEVNSWLRKSLDLSPYQNDKLIVHEIVRSSEFEFYKPRAKEKVSVLWRLTLIPWAICWVIFLIGLPINMLITGKWGYTKPLTTFFMAWADKLKL